MSKLYQITCLIEKDENVRQNKFQQSCGYGALSVSKASEVNIFYVTLHSINYTRFSQKSQRRLDKKNIMNIITINIKLNWL